MDYMDYMGAGNLAMGRWQPNTVEPITQATPTAYVDATATGSGSGADWTNAYTTIMAAFAGEAAGSVISVSGGASGVTYTENLSAINKAITIQGSTEPGHDGLVTVDGAFLINISSGFVAFNNFKIGVKDFAGIAFRLHAGTSIHNNMQFGVNTSVADNNVARQGDHTFNYCTFSESGYKISNGSTNLMSLQDAVDLEFNFCTFQVSGNVVTLPASSTINVNNCTVLPFHYTNPLFYIGNNANSTVNINRSAFFGVQPVNSGALSVLNVDRCYWTKQPGVTGASGNSPYFDSSNVAVITDTISNVDPKFTTPRNSTIGQFFLRYDDRANLDVSVVTAATLNPEIVLTHAVNLHGRNFPTRPTAQEIDDMRTLIANGNEIISHGGDHSDNADLGTINISATGTAPTLGIVVTQAGDSTTWANTLTVTINGTPLALDLMNASYDTLTKVITALNGTALGDGTITCSKSNANNADTTFSAMLAAVVGQDISGTYEMSFDRTAYNQYEVTEPIADLTFYINAATDRNGANAVAGTTVAVPNPVYVCKGYASPYGLGDASIVTLLQTDANILHGNQANGANLSTYYNYGVAQNMYNNLYTNMGGVTDSEDLFSMAAAASGGPFVYFPLFHSGTPVYNGSLANFKAMLTALDVGNQTMAEYFTYIRGDGGWAIAEPNASFTGAEGDYLNKGVYSLIHGSPLYN